MRFEFTYNPASQIVTRWSSNDAYAWTGHFNENKAGTANGLNQLTQVGPKSMTHDVRGNVTAFGTKSFTYSSENLMKTGPGSTDLHYDPALRLEQVVAGGTTRLAYDGLDRIAEHDGAGAVQRRYMFGPGIDEPLVWYEGSGTTDRRFLEGDERGSVIHLADTAGATLATNRYDEYGKPQMTNLGNFGYTGQAWLPTIGEWYYKARDYHPELGRFVQTDPIGYADSPNLYAYVLNDPINSKDPTGRIVAPSACPLIGGVHVCIDDYDGDDEHPSTAFAYLHGFLGDVPEWVRLKTEQAKEWVKQCGSQINGAEVVISTGEGMVVGSIFTGLQETLRGKPPRGYGGMFLIVVRGGASGATKNVREQVTRNC